MVVLGQHAGEDRVARDVAVRGANEAQRGMRCEVERRQLDPAEAAADEVALVGKGGIGSHDF